MSYPTYGCQGHCDCSNDTCDVSSGCIEITTSACMFLDIKFIKKKNKALNWKQTL